MKDFFKGLGYSFLIFLVNCVLIFVQTHYGPELSKYLDFYYIFLGNFLEPWIGGYSTILLSASLPFLIGNTIAVLLSRNKNLRLGFLWGYMFLVLNISIITIFFLLFYRE